MGNTKRYRVEHNEANFVLLVEVDLDKFTSDAQAEINNFWSDAKARLSDEDGDLLRAVLKMLCAYIMRLQVEYDYRTDGIINLFDWDKGHGQEGWPKMDGSFGIKIVHASDVEFVKSDMVVTELV